MRVLITNNTLERPAGTELSVFDYAVTLQKRGHDVAAFSCQLGEIAERISAAGIPVRENLESMPWIPEVIHGHHRWETTLAALFFPETPVISFCRGTQPWQEAPSLAPNVARWVGVDRPCCELLAARWNLPEDRIDLIPNGVDPERFPERTSPLPAAPRRVLVLSNYAREDNFFAMIHRACEREGITCEGIGAGLKNAVSDPAPVLAAADLVFAKGKAALEAMFSGCGVIVCDENGIGPLVTRENFEFVRGQSFAYEAMSEPVTEAAVGRRLAAWNVSEITEAAGLARKEGTLDRTVDGLEECYRMVLADWENRDRPGVLDFTRSAAALFSEATLPYKLGREAREIWRKRNPPEAKMSGTAEMNRILHVLRDSERRVGKLEEKLVRQDEKIAGLKRKLAEEKEKSTRRRWFLGPK